MLLTQEYQDIIRSLRNIEMPRNVGAHNPTKIPNRSAWALSSEVTPLFMYQIEIDPTTDTRLKTNVIIDSVFIF